jgi:hypothetical protein
MKTKLLREDKTLKPDFTILPYKALAKLAKQFTKGAEKYKRFNYLNCEDPQTYKESLIRHTLQYIDQQKDEDHLMAVAANAIILLELQERGVTNNER